MEIVEETKAYPDALASLHDGAVLDIVMPKPHSEVLVGGYAYCPPDKPVRQRQIALQLGGLKKSLLVSGDRTNKGLLHVFKNNQPDYFDKLPFSYTLSFGGKKNPFNPIGRGQQKNKDGFKELPNFEFSGPQNKNEPAGFGPLDISWKPRKDKAGHYDEKWMKEEYPGLARDVDWSIYNAAPQDQQLKGFLNGGEYYALTGMHPEKERIEGILPRFRARAFLQFEQAYGGEFREVPCHAETIWFFPDKELGLILYRGITPVQDSDSLDIAGLMLAHEHLDDSPRELAYYENVYQLKTSPATKRLHALNEAILSPIKSEEEITQQAKQQLQAEQDYLKKKQALIDAHMQHVLDKTGLELPEDFKWPKAEPIDFPIISKEAIASGDLDLSAIMQSVDKQVKKIEAEKEKQLQELDAISQKWQPAVIKPDISDEDKQKVIEEKITPISFKHDLEKLNNKSETEEETVERIKLATVREARRHAPGDMSDTSKLDDEARDRLTAEINKLIQNGESLAGRDLAGAVLAGLDFSGQDLREVMLENAVLDDCDFSDCQCQGAVFTGASLDRTRFNRCLLHNTNFSKCTGINTDFSGSSIEDAMFSHAQFEGALFRDCRLIRVDASFAAFKQSDFSGSEIQQLKIINGDLGQCKLDRTQILQMIAINAEMQHSSWQETRIERSLFVQSRLDNSDFSNSNLKSLQTGGKASFTGTSFKQANGFNCGWRGVDFSDADFSSAIMAKCDFGDALFSDTKLDEAILYQSILSAARFSHSSLVRTNLHQVQARKTQFDECDFNEANLIDANFTEAKFNHCHLDKIEILNRDMLQT